MAYTKDDLKILEEQLGRKPRNVVDIAKRCPDQQPEVVVTAPILEKEDSLGIFPTTLWLTCPELNSRIAKLESKGLVQEIQEEIFNNQELKERLKKAHQNYAEYRVNLVNSKTLEEIKNTNPGQYKVLTESGVGGILEFEGIKCLHTHYAHYLVDQINPVGEIVAKLLEEEYGQIEVEDCCMN